VALPLALSEKPVVVALVAEEEEHLPLAEEGEAAEEGEGHLPLELRLDQSELNYHPSSTLTPFLFKIFFHNYFTIV
jgi:hypothetical protein